MPLQHFNVVKRVCRAALQRSKALKNKKIKKEVDKMSIIYYNIIRKRKGEKQNVKH